MDMPVTTFTDDYDEDPEVHFQFNLNLEKYVIALTFHPRLL